MKFLGFLLFWRKKRSLVDVMVATAEELSRDRDALLIEVLGKTGLRVSELVRVRVKDVDPLRYSLMVHTDRLGAGEHPVPPATMGKIQAYVRAHHLAADAPLFPTNAMTINHIVRHVSLETEKRHPDEMQRIRSEISISRGVTPHTLRHEYGMQIWSQHGDVAARVLLGHHLAQPPKISREEIQAVVQDTFTTDSRGLLARLTWHERLTWRCRDWLNQLIPRGKTE